METPPQIEVNPKSSDKVLGILCHVSTFLGTPFLLPLIVYLVTKKESAYVASNAREALNFHISFLIYAFLCVPLIWLIIGIPLLIVLGLGSLVLSVLAAVKASEGQCYRYPLTIRLV